jgi:CrcB protein
MTKLLFIAGGGALGSVLRYLVAGWGQRLTPGVFPLGTLLVNVTGCLLIGYLGTLFAGPAVVREEYRLALLIGLLGGFTTFSTFGYETWALLSDREWGLAGANVLLSNVLGLGAVWLGHRLAVIQGG